MPKYEVRIKEIRYATEIIEADDEWRAEDLALREEGNLIDWEDDEREVLDIEELQDEEDEEKEPKAEVEEKE